MMKLPMGSIGVDGSLSSGLAAALAAMTVTAQAQQGNQMGAASNVGQHAAAASAKAGADETKVKANDKAYNAALRNLPDKQYDPGGASANGADRGGG
jgi:hypothetical protein